MTKNFILFLSIIFLSSCAHNLELISRNKSPNGVGNAQELGKQVTININGKEYKGTYVYDGMKIFTTTGNATATAYNRSGSTTAYANGSSTSYIPGSGNGKIIATSGDDTIRCDFMYEDFSGLGYCTNNTGNEYDLIIH